MMLRTRQPDGSWVTDHNPPRLGPIRTTTQSPNLCYLCGADQATTDEHVFPRAFYRISESDREGPVLKAHNRCNHQYSADEEDIRNLLAGSAGAAGSTHAFALKKTESALNFNRTKTGDAAVRARSKLARVRRAIKRRPDGTFAWETSETHKQLCRIFEKMVRGFGYWVTGKPAPASAASLWTPDFPFEEPALPFAPLYHLVVRNGLEVAATFFEDDNWLVRGDTLFTFYEGVRAHIRFETPA